MSKKVPQLKPSRANRPRNAFDLSQRHLFTASAGMLLPVMSLDLMPHDHIELQATDFMRTIPMNSAAFMSMKGVYEFFFVPYAQLFRGFDQLITGMNDYRSSFLYDSFNKKTPVKVPAVELGELAQHIAGLDKTDNDLMGFPLKDDLVRLCDLLGYGRFCKVDGTLRNDVKVAKEKVTPFRLAAYQKIYMDYYRNSTYENYETKSFNFDEVTKDFTAVDFVKRFGQMRYRNAQRDLFTNIYPKPLFDLPNNFDEWFYQGELQITNVGKQSHSVDIDLGSGTQSETGGVTISVADIRNAFALDKLLSITMRAGKTYAEQMAAHFGIEVSEGRDGRVVYCGGFDAPIQVGDVTQQAGTTAVGNDTKYGGYLGKVTGKAIGSGSGKITFDAKEHGVFMCIYSLVPDMQYDSSRIDPFVLKQKRGDFFMPEFENLGMQILPSKWISDVNWSASTLYGWQPRYSEYKTALDINHGQFMDGQPLSYWSVGRARSGTQDLLSTLSVASLKINPRWLNSVFVGDYNGSEVSDQIFGGCLFNIQKVSDMSVDGLPSV